MGFAFLSPFFYLCYMFIRQVKKKNSATGKTFFQYQLLQAARINGKVKHQNVLYLGSEPLLANEEARKMTLQLLRAKIFRQPLLFAKDFPNQVVDLAEAFYKKFLVKYKDVSIDEALSLPAKPESLMEKVAVEDIEIENSKTFGGEHLCSQVLGPGMLNLGQCLDSLGFSKEESDLAQVSIVGRALFSASEHKTAQYLRDNSGLCGLYNLQEGDVNHRQLYSIADKLYAKKEAIDKYLYNKVVDLFDLKDSMVIYDLSNTYFEGRKAASKRAKFGKSKQKRNDCKQVVFTGVINAQGFIRYSRVYDGNTSDMVTLHDMVADLKNPIDLLVFTPEGFKDTWMYVKSEQKRVKEQSMGDKLSQCFEQELEGLSAGLKKKGTTKKIQKVYERIGRMKEKHRLISGKYTIDVEEKDGQAVRVTWGRKKENQDQGDKNSDNGVYFIRTSYEKPNEEQLWQVYNTIREVEATFRCLKSDLQIRPIHHQNDERAESHIYLTILAYQLVNTIRYMLKNKGINHDWKNIVRIMNTQTIQELIIPAETKKISLVKPSKPIQEAQQIYKATNTKSMIPTKKKYVVYH